ncbi:MAG TPA: thioredoxin [Eubacteriales bacterium]|nr:thioredoxin [Eubacteriales bacterium]
MSKVEVVTSKNFDKFISGVAVVDYWATWCGPCKMLAPVLEQVADQLPTVKFGKVNVDEESDLANAAEVQAIPNVCIYKNGELVDRIIGVQPLAKIVETIKKHL